MGNFPDSYNNIYHGLSDLFSTDSVHFGDNVGGTIGGAVGSIVGGVVGGVVGGGCCICLALCVCISICCCYHKKCTASTTTNTTTFSITAIPMDSLQPAPVATINQLTAVQETMAEKQDNKPLLEYNPDYDPTPKAGFTSYPVTHTKPSPYPPTPEGTRPPSCPPAGHTFPQDSLNPSTGDASLPPAYPAPGGTLPQQQYPAQPPADLLPPYSGPSPFQ